MYTCQQRTVLSQKWKINEMSPVTFLAYCFESFWTVVQGGETQAESTFSSTSAAHRINWSLPRFAGQSIWKERAAQRENWKYLEGHFWVFSLVLIIWETNWGHSQEWENTAWHTNRARHSASSPLLYPDRLENLKIHRTLGRVYTEFCLSNGD